MGFLSSLFLVSFSLSFSVFQAEKWVRAKLWDLKDGCSIQEWEQGTQILQRDMKDFENTMIKLNQVR